MVDPSVDVNEGRLAKLQSWLCLMPVFGIVPAMWSLYHPQTTPSVRKSSRLALQLTGSWFLLWLLLFVASHSPNEFMAFRTQYLNGLLTSGYFVTCFLAMLWQRKR